MVPKIADSGSSFTGAGRYYLHDKRPEPPASGLRNDFESMADYALHDKRDRATAHRVGFTHTLNLDTDEPQSAIQQMTARYDAFREREKNKRGRKLTQPLYSYSLSWAPDEQPTQDEMMRAVHSSLKALRLEGLQTLIIQHTDEPQPHVHVLVNRIEESGKNARNIAYDKLRMSRWAEAWEREQGQIRCPERVVNNELRRQGIPVKDTKSRPYADYKAERAAQAAALKDWRNRADEEMKGHHSRERNDLWNRQQRERQAHEKATYARIEAGRAAIKARFKSAWSTLYREQKAEQRELSRMSITDRLAFVIAHHKRLVAKPTAKVLLGLVMSKKKLAAALARDHERARAGLSNIQREDYGQVARLAWRDHREDFDVRIAPRHQMERDGLKFEISAQWQAVREARAKGVDARAFEAAYRAASQPPEPATPAPSFRDQFEKEASRPSPPRPELSAVTPATIEDAILHAASMPAPAPAKSRAEIIQEQERAYAEKLRREGRSMPDFGRDFDP